MRYVVLGAWLIQAGVGIVLLAGWIRHGRGRSAATVLTHVALAVAGLALWASFVMTGALLPAWSAFAVLTAVNGFGDAMLIRRHRRAVGRTTFWKDYGRAIAAVFAGRMPKHVSFHALFAGVVYFTCLGVCIGASMG